MSVYKPDGKRILGRIREDLSLGEGPVRNTVELIVGGATVPFIARYRKEKTGGLDEIKIRGIRDKLQYYSELEQRKETVLNTIDSQGKLADGLKRAIVDCRDKQALEDLYLPYKPKKRTKATMAREKGLDALAAILLKQDKILVPEEEVLGPFIDPEKGVGTPEEALAGAVDILAETITEDAEIRGWLREYFEKNGLIVTRPRPEWEGKKSKFDMYYQFREYIKESPSHRLLAIRRGAGEKVISWRIEVDPEPAIRNIGSRYIRDRQHLFVDHVRRAVKNAYKRLAVSMEFEVFSKKLQEAEAEAIRVFSKNLRNLLLDPPAGHKMIMGIDPGFRTGCKVAVIDAYGHFKEYAPIFPHPPLSNKREAAEAIRTLLDKYGIELIAVGNGTASRETVDFIRMLLREGYADRVKLVVVSEAGASVYSASEAGMEEFPDLDVTVRGAISIARRLQDPLSELVKIDPKSIGVGQYQHDVNQVDLKRELQGVVESCVNYVGVELNTSSKELLSYVSGIGPTLAENIVKYREENGPFERREKLKKVFMLGDRAFEQCAGFLRIRTSPDPLDNSAIHPESYHIVKKMAGDLALGVERIIGNARKISRINPENYVGDDAGLPTIKDILKELEKPGLDPREKFENIEFRQDINDIEDLKPDMKLFGKVTNVTNFGAFVDVGVHQDGLIHISNLNKKKFVKDPHEEVSVGDRVRVKVLSVDVELKRIDLERMS